MEPSNATIAEYFRLAVEAGALPQSAAHRWADEKISRSETAPGDIVDVSWGTQRAQLLKALGKVDGDRDFQLAARWVLRTVYNQLVAGGKIADAIYSAKHVVLSGGVGVDLYYTLSSIEDALAIAELGHHGTEDEAKLNLEHLLLKEAAPALPGQLV